MDGSDSETQPEPTVSGMLPVYFVRDVPGPYHPRGTPSPPISISVHSKGVKVIYVNALLQVLILKKLAEENRKPKTKTPARMLALRKNAVLYRSYGTRRVTVCQGKNTKKQDDCRVVKFAKGVEYKGRFCEEQG